MCRMGNTLNLYKSGNILDIRVDGGKRFLVVLVDSVFAGGVVLAGSIVILIKRRNLSWKVVCMVLYEYNFFRQKVNILRTLLL